MDYPYWKTLKLDQKAYFIEALTKFDRMMRALISSASDSSAMQRPSERLSTNLDFKKKGISCLEKFSNYIARGGIDPEFVAHAVSSAEFEIRKIVEGQPRWHVRSSLNQARANLIHYFTLAGEAMIDFDYQHPHL